ncbi:hypothetical protein ZEAMMB73_Zm00001d006502 [Zea mays]|uniref:Uncharacterized protein n=1 Tax=Zea mays TaxID=4577 RepID=A0A1D6EX53_MAIZE|nr:hypothetical protein ZEAMMB73_Zm00001d006502 [Zea mays]
MFVRQLNVKTTKSSVYQLYFSEANTVPNNDGMS